jgi:myo-inositol-1(or 4)-monophosphatase
MDEYLVFAKDLARQAGQLIKDGFDSNLKVELKSDHSPVTQVDKNINKLVIEAIKAKYPEHGILGEESSLSTGREELQWLCDPLDGTVAFIVGMQHSTFILGLTKEGSVLLAVIYNPFTGHLYHAVKGGGAFCNDRMIHVNNHPLRDGFVLIEQSTTDIYGVLQKAGAITEPVAGAGYRAALLASGRCSAIIQAKADFHDVGPASLIVEEAGGKVTDLSGRNMRFDQLLTDGIVLSNGLSHDQLLKIVASNTTN